MTDEQLTDAWLAGERFPALSAMNKMFGSRGCSSAGMALKRSST
jgi:hypothetical protein